LHLGHDFTYHKLTRVFGRWYILVLARRKMREKTLPVYLLCISKVSKGGRQPLCKAVMLVAYSTNVRGEGSEIILKFRLTEFVDSREAGCVVCAELRK